MLNVTDPFPDAFPAENGAPRYVGIVLADAPIADVHVHLALAQPASWTGAWSVPATLSAAKLVFTSANWATQQNVAIAAIDDAVQDGASAHARACVRACARAHFFVCRRECGRSLSRAFSRASAQATSPST